MDLPNRVVSTKVTLPGKVREGSQEEVSIQELSDKKETQEPAPIHEGALIRKLELRSRKSKVMGQR